jgi:transposase
MRKIRQVLDYRFDKKISAEQTALALLISKGSVINYVERFERSKLPWPLPDGFTDTALEEALFPAITGDCEPELPDIGYLEKELARQHMTLQRLFEEYQEQNPTGLSRSAFYRYVARRRSKRVFMTMHHKGGEELYIDYSGDGLEYIDRLTGEIVPVELFACAWGASSYAYAEGTLSQKTPDFVSSHVRALAYFGAVPHSFIPDNLKSGVKKSDRYDPDINPLYEKMAEHYGVAVLPARVKKPRDKAIVENAVLQVQRFILARLRNRQFFSLDEVNTAIAEELESLNNRPMKDYGGQTRRQRFEALDKPYAKSLPTERFKISRLKLKVRVAPNYHVRFEDHYYSVPHHLAGCLVDIYQVGAILELYHDNVHLCRHQVQASNYGYTTIKEHMPSNHAFVKGWSQQWFIFKAGEIGPATAEAVKQIMAAREHVQQGYNAAFGVLRLAKTHTPDRLERACQRALHFKTVSYRTLKAILDQHLDKQTFLPLPEQNYEPIFHENIRGPQYYPNH